MKQRILIARAAATCLIIVLFKAPVLAEEKIIQQEKMSFNQCLNVITVSADKLSIGPEITEISKKKRVALFTLSDGTLTITCDGDVGNVTVSTKAN